AKVFAAEGLRVALNGRDADRLESAVADLALAGTPAAASFVADVSQPEQAGDLVRRAQQELGSLDILVCNAGGPPPGSAVELSEDAWLDALQLNLLSTVHLCRAAAGSMIDRGWGRLLCLASVAAKQPVTGLILSTTARAGVLGFAKSLADEVAHAGVTVNVLCPGYIATERLLALADERARAESQSRDDVLAAMASTIPIGRIGQPEELAWVAAFLVSERARYVTGTALSVDGGLARTIL
ncbi:MAG: SDR family oxidoreductase, partial [Gemmatimonadales bacterium]|nr:SDR family oxidoreductase [Gemmatimonadales bacterium]